ncbi:FAD-dependent 2-octaprenylphenol hydroxylase [Candidatus Hamiltonella defensa]|uniref:FAD-dependent 2-octaprenylphenol hydroxylase n=1 Tax=Candidatus Williamhamiltonella defendens TaxID=138072 RepID=UPI0015826B49|nr:FAD-dependent 2-octaprenylphenol hydroxylase [Candidatus Hamiltonella defensa]
MQSVDIVIAGGGMVGLALACGLKGTGLSVALLEKDSLEHKKTLFSRDKALRVSAIHAASEQLLKYIGIWDQILVQGACAYTSMEVWDKDSFGKIFFHAQEQGCHHLGYIIENQAIEQALWQKATESDHITLLAPAHFQQVAWSEDAAFVTLADGRLLSARLVVAADGAHSWLRQHSAIPVTFWDYHQHALVAVIRTEQPHQQTARQIFYEDGILAFLPLKEAHLSSIVWSLPFNQSTHFLQCPEAQFNQSLAVAFDMRLGLCELQGQRQTFPLKARYARSFAAHRLVLVGDSAHTIHPLAGQGVNLGFMDVAELISEIQRLKTQGKEIGHYPYLRRYERQRKQSAAFMLAAMQGFGVLFSGDKPIKKWIRNTGINLVNKCPSIKSKFFHHAMGLDEGSNFLKDL